MLRKKRILAATAAMAATMFVTLGGGVSYAVSETGAPDVDTSTVTLTTTQQSVIDAKLAKVTAYQNGMHVGPSTVPDSCIPACPSRTFTLQSPAQKYEGQGNTYYNSNCACYTPKTWTCGPSSTRNMVITMGASDPGEHQLELWENTSSSNGTIFGNIVNTLNNHYGSYGTWSLHKPSSESNLLAVVATDTWYYRQPLIQNVQTSYLPYWNGHSAKHYNMIYGYSYDTPQIYVDEEWNTAKNLVGTAAYGNPYGLHSPSLAHDYDAVIGSPSHNTTI